MTEVDKSAGDTAKETAIAVDNAAVKAAFGSTLNMLGMETRNTVVGDIVFFNTHYVPPKVLNIIQWFLDTQAEGFSGLYSIVFRMDGQPNVDDKGTLTSWMFYPGSMTAVCNIRGCIDVALDEALSGDIKEAACLNTWGVIWRAIIQNFFHEAHHAKSCLTKREALAVKGSKARDDEEMSATDYAQTMMIEAAKHMDVEIEFTAELSEIIADRLQVEIDDIKGDDKSPEHQTAWAINMEYMTKHGFIVHVPKDDGGQTQSYTTLKEYLHFQSGDAEDDPAWVTQAIETTCVGTYGNTTGQPNYIIPDSNTDLGYSDDGLENFGDGEITDQNFHCPENPQTNNGAGYQNNNNYQPQTQIQNPVQGPPGQQQRGNTQAMVQQNVATTGGTFTFGQDQHQAIVKRLYAKLAGKIFEKCQFVVGQTATMADGVTPSKFFMNVKAIEAPIELDAEELQLVQSQTITINGAYKKDQPVQDNLISGLVIGKQELQAGYELVLHNGSGGTIRRKFVPQNPWGPSATATWAKNGQQVVWILEPFAADKATCMRVVDGQVQSNSSGQWQNV